MSKRDGNDFHYRRWADGKEIYFNTTDKKLKRKGLRNLRKSKKFARNNEIYSTPEPKLEEIENG